MLCIFGVINLQAASKNIQSNVEIKKISTTSIEVVVTGDVTLEAIHHALVSYPGRFLVTHVNIAPEIRAQLQKFNDELWLWDYPCIMRPLIQDEIAVWVEALSRSGSVIFGLGGAVENFSFEQ